MERHHNEECKKLLGLMGVPVIDAPGEAEAQCAEVGVLLVVRVSVCWVGALVGGSNLPLLQHLSTQCQHCGCQHCDSCCPCLPPGCLVLQSPWLGHSQPTTLPFKTHAHTSAPALSQLNKEGLVYGIATEDMDSLTFGTPRLIRHLMAPVSQKVSVTEYDYSQVGASAHDFNQAGAVHLLTTATWVQLSCQL